MSSVEHQKKDTAKLSTYFLYTLGILLAHGYVFGLGAPTAFENDEVGWWLFCCGLPLIVADSYLLIEMIKKLGQTVPIGSEVVEDNTAKSVEEVEVSSVSLNATDHTKNE